jgi:hypothetical protein
MSTESKTYNGSCHCGANKFSAVISPPLEAEGSGVTSCNCSICNINGYLLTFSRTADTTWTAGGLDKLTGYKFGKEKIQHYFCPTCGTSVCCEGVDPNFFPGMLGWNVSVSFLEFLGILSC